MLREQSHTLAAPYKVTSCFVERNRNASSCVSGLLASDLQCQRLVCTVQNSDAILSYNTASEVKLSKTPNDRLANELLYNILHVDMVMHKGAHKAPVFRTGFSAC